MSKGKIWTTAQVSLLRTVAQRGFRRYKIHWPEQGLDSSLFPFLFLLLFLDFTLYMAVTG